MVQAVKSLPPYQKEMSPTASNDTGSSSIHPELPDSSGSDEPSSSSTELKDRKKKKRNPVVIHDHITVISGIKKTNIKMYIFFKEIN
jgi:hypothetical protein